jgi:hypothetical protein
MSSRISAGILTTLAGLTLSAVRLHAQSISQNYPGDAGIESDPNVILVEKFEEASLSNVLGRWPSANNAAGMSLDPDVPAGSPGTRSLKMTGVGGSNTGGSLYRTLSPGENDRIYLRYYIKYASGGTYHHAGGQFGGYHPPTPWPQGTAGLVPTGADRFTIGFEAVDPPNHRFEFYVYWKDMQSIWGNYFINDPTLLVPKNAWTCCEIMVKLNNPVSASNGELAAWVNGQPRGPYTNLQWRTDPAVNLNWIWLLYYVTQDPPGYVGTVKWDHVVVARSYIGPMVGGAAPVPSPPGPVPPPGATPPAAPVTPQSGGSGNSDATRADRCGCGSIPVPGGWTWTLVLLASGAVFLRRR